MDLWAGSQVYFFLIKFGRFHQVLRMFIPSPLKHTPFCPKKYPKKSAVASLAPSMVSGAEATDGASAFQAVPRRFGNPGNPGSGAVKFNLIPCY